MCRISCLQHGGRCTFSCLSLKDGSMCLVFDIDSLIRHYAGHHSDEARQFIDPRCSMVK